MSRKKKKKKKKNKNKNNKNKKKRAPALAENVRPNSSVPRAHKGDTQEHVFALEGVSLPIYMQ